MGRPQRRAQIGQGTGPRCAAERGPTKRVRERTRLNEHRPLLAIVVN